VLQSPPNQYKHCSVSVTLTTHMRLFILLLSITTIVDLEVLQLKQQQNPQNKW
jgi:hypothetical protein